MRIILSYPDLILTGVTKVISPHYKKEDSTDYFIMNLVSKYDVSILRQFFFLSSKSICFLACVVLSSRLSVTLEYSMMRTVGSRHC